MKAFSGFYVNYIIKNPFIFYAFLFIGAFTFIVLTLTIKINIIETYSAAVEGKTIKLENSSISDFTFEEAYVYSDRNKEVAHVSISKIDFSNNQTYIYLSESDSIKLLGFDKVNIDIVVGQRTLLETIFVRAGRG
ncbi:MAG: hypothetical protein LBG07_05900 [Treponema sp.]|jgi:hypothetical protein|nr:hypothetical protein [Treponema sp.]